MHRFGFALCRAVQVLSQSNRTVIIEVALDSITRSASRRVQGIKLLQHMSNADSRDVYILRHLGNFVSIPQSVYAGSARQSKEYVPPSQHNTDMDVILNQRRCLSCGLEPGRLVCICIDGCMHVVIHIHLCARVHLLEMCWTPNAEQQCAQPRRTDYSWAAHLNGGA